MIFKSKLRKKIETMRSERLYERAELRSQMSQPINNRQGLFTKDLKLEEQIKLLDEILSK